MGDLEEMWKRPDCLRIAPTRYFKTIVIDWFIFVHWFTLSLLYVGRAVIKIEYYRPITVATQFARESSTA
jgi:hypothetical protein